MVKNNKIEEKRSSIYIFTYLFEFLSGIVAYFVSKGDERVKAHAKQAIILGLSSILVSVVFNLISAKVIGIILTFFIWIYGMYIGINAYYVRDSKLPFMAGYIWGTVEKDKDAKERKKLIKVESDTGDEALKALRLRYANGEITKKQFDKMKKNLES